MVFAIRALFIVQLNIIGIQKNGALQEKMSECQIATES